MERIESPYRGIFGLNIDTLMVGGLSLLLIGTFLLFGSMIPRDLIFSQYLLLTVLINGTHFMASYRLLYGDRGNPKRYPWASIYLPAFLVIYSVFCFICLQYDPIIDWPIHLLLIVTSLYLALHYTGQAWGMFCSYAYLTKLSLQPRERLILRWCINVMAAWHMIWALSLLPHPPEWMATLLPTAFACVNGLAIASFIAVVSIYIKVAIRIKSIPSRLVVIPVFTLYLWYLFLWIYPQALFWVQLSHALQYHSFPLRVELNRAGHTAERGVIRAHLLRYCFQLLLASAAVFVGFEFLLNFPNGGRSAYWHIILSGINIHHYFIDGCIWKLRNKVVKDELFAHIREESAFA